MGQKKQMISGWGNYPVRECYLERPEKVSQVKFEDVKTIPRGLGRSYGDAALNSDQRVLLMERLNRFLGFDQRTGLLRAEAGVSLEDILTVFVPRGWFLSVTPGTKFTTLGGCIAADVHGKNHHCDGGLGAHIRELEIILADGTRKRCSPKKDRDLFWATVGGMGLTGIIIEATLQLIPIESAYMMVKHHVCKDLETVLEHLSDTDNDDKYSVAWIDCLATGKDLGRSVVMNAHHATVEELSNQKLKSNPLLFKSPKKIPLPFTLPGWVLNPWSIKAFNSCYYYMQSKKVEPFITDYDRYFYPLDAIENWNRGYGKKGFLQYQFVVPSKNAHESLQEILTQLTENQYGSFLAVLKRFGNEGPGMLSFPREGYTLALDIPITTEELFPFLDRLDEMVIHYDGRVYLAKDARLKPESFRKMYPRYPEWLKVKEQVDPSNLFSSDMSRRLKMEEMP